MHKHLNIIFKILIFFILLSCKQSPEIKLQTGDLLFQDLDCGPLCDAIEEATIGKNGERFSHIAIVSVENDEVFIIEAYDGVKKIPISEFIERDIKAYGKSNIVVGRLNKQYQKYIKNAVLEAKKRIGLPYDDVFKLNNDKYYCSELIYDIFKDPIGTSIFSVKPMTFKNQKTGKTDDVWIKHFKDQNTPIPEGAPGSNPIDYFQSNKLTILGKYHHKP